MQAEPYCRRPHKDVRPGRCLIWIYCSCKCKYYTNAHINVMPAGAGGRAWGGDLIVFVVPGVGHLTDLVLPGEGIFESFFARRGDI